MDSTHRRKGTLWLMAAAGVIAALCAWVWFKGGGGPLRTPPGGGEMHGTNDAARQTASAATKSNVIGSGEAYTSHTARLALDVTAFERLYALLSSPAISDDMPAEERARRRLYFDAFNKPETIGPTGCPYDAPVYRSLTNPILTQAEIDVIINAQLDLATLMEVALDFASGNGTLRDVHAADILFQHIIQQARKKGDMGTYLSALRSLGEHRMLPIGLADPARSVQPLEEALAACTQHDAAALGISSEEWAVHHGWSLGNLAYCYEQLGHDEAAERMYAQLIQNAPRQEHFSASFFRIINAARAVTGPQPGRLLDWAAQLERLASEYRQAHAHLHSPLLEKIMGQARSFRTRAEILVGEQHK